MEPHTRISSGKYSQSDFFQDIDAFKYRFCKQNGLDVSRTRFLKKSDSGIETQTSAESARRHLTFAVYIDNSLFCHLDFIDSVDHQIDVFTMALS